MCGIIGVFNDPEARDKLKKDRLVSDLAIYNWKALNKKYGLNARSGSDLLLKLIDAKGVSKLPEILEEMRGVYAFAYFNGDCVYLARDVIGIRPLFYSTNPCFAFASKKKALTFSEDIVELNPREILCYDTKTGQIDRIQRKLFVTAPGAEGDIHQRLEELLFDAVRVRIPDRKFGLLFSGGVDSSLIAHVLKKLGAEFTCYTAVLEENADDLKNAKESAEELGVTLRYRTVGMDRLEEYIRKVVSLIGEPDVVKVGVALPMYAACEMAQEDGCKVIFSGLGPDELFGGYQRHKKSENVNKVCLSDLLKMHKRNTYRDYVTTTDNNLELRLPYLDTELVEFALRIPARYKIDGEKEKIVLRELAEKLDIDHEIAWRKKRAAQYGSRFDWGIEKLAKRHGLSKSEYLKLYREEDVMLGVLSSSGKDSTYAMHVMKRQNYPISCLISIVSKNPDSYMFHTPNVDLVKLQAEALGIPHIEQKTEGIKEKELDDLEKALRKAIEKYHIEGVVTGAIYSNYQKKRIEKVCDRVGLEIFSPIWHIDQELEMRQVVREFEIVFSCVAARGLDKSWLGRRIVQADVDRLVELNKTFGINIAGEGGEFESLVLDAPLFRKRIRIDDFEIIEEKNAARMVVKRAGLVDK